MRGYWYRELVLDYRAASLICYFTSWGLKPDMPAALELGPPGTSLETRAAGRDTHRRSRHTPPVETRAAVEMSSHAPPVETRHTLPVETRAAGRETRRRYVSCRDTILIVLNVIQIYTTCKL